MMAIGGQGFQVQSVPQGTRQGLQTMNDRELHFYQQQPDLDLVAIDNDIQAAQMRKIYKPPSAEEGVA